MRVPTGLLVVASLLVCVTNLLAQEVEPRHGKVLVCYMASWGIFLPGNGRFDVVDALPAMSSCTHLVYMFVGLAPDTNTIKVLSPERDLLENFGLGGIGKSVDFKRSFPSLKVLVSLGGWEEGSVNYSNMVSSSATRRTFIDSVVKFLSDHNLDGIEVNWQYPGDRGGKASDRTNLVLLIKEMKGALQPSGKLVSVVVNGNLDRISRGIDIRLLSRYADFISVWTFEYHGYWDGKVLPGAPLMTEDHMDVAHTITLLLENGAKPEKLLLGISNYGMAYELAAPTDNAKDVIGQPSKGATNFLGPFTSTNGFIGYNEVCLWFKDGWWSKQWHKTSSTPFLVNVVEDKVVCFEDEESVREKVKYAMTKKLGGITYYSLEKDDFRGSCSPSQKTYPILTAINDNLIIFSKLLNN